jgi:hypothetical protein
MTARERLPLGSRWGLIRIGRRSVNDVMPRRLRALPGSPPRKSAWRRTCAHRQGVQCTRGAKASWNRGLARAKRDGVCVGSGCAVWTTSVVRGGGCV